MPLTEHRSWFAWLLYRLLWFVALGMILIVIVAPWVENRLSSRVLAVFARDVTLRRTAVASALGLIVTACVFFRTPRPGQPESPRSSRPSDVAGA